MEISNGRMVAMACLAATFVVGIGCLMCGMMLDDVLPHFMLDHVLSPEELNDKATRDRTLSLLKAMKSGHSRYWFLTGVILIGLGATGLWSLARGQPTHSAESHG